MRRRTQGRLSGEGVCVAHVLEGPRVGATFKVRATGSTPSRDLLCC